MIVTAQFSIYPLGTADPGRSYDAAIAAAREVGAAVEVGRMASFIEGEEQLIFAALRAAFMAAAGRRDTVLVATVSNAC